MYALAFIALFIYRPGHAPGVALLRSSAFIILIFYIMWGNYQSHYILTIDRNPETINKEITLMTDVNINCSFSVALHKIFYG